MKSSPRFHRPSGPGLCLCLAFALISGCESGPGSESPDKTGRISTYAGAWTFNGTSGSLDATKSLVITSDLAYSKTTHQYESTAKVNLVSIQATTATVTEIAVDETNEAYDTIFIDIHEVQLTPKTAGEAAEWNAAEYGGVTTWAPDVTLTFTSSNPGPWEFGTIWLHHVAVSVRREGNLLNVNERGGFDGQDPPEDVYSLAG